MLLKHLHETFATWPQDPEALKLVVGLGEPLSEQGSFSKVFVTQPMSEFPDNTP